LDATLGKERLHGFHEFVDEGLVSLILPDVEHHANAYRVAHLTA